MRVLLTGSAGFIGAAVARALEERGDEVVRVDMMLDMAHGSAALPEGTHHLDVRDAADGGEWARLLAGVDVVCHQAAVVGAGLYVAAVLRLRGVDVHLGHSPGLVVCGVVVAAQWVDE